MIRRRFTPTPRTDAERVILGQMKPDLRETVDGCSTDELRAIAGNLKRSAIDLLLLADEREKESSLN